MLRVYVPEPREVRQVRQYISVDGQRQHRPDRRLQLIRCVHLCVLLGVIVWFMISRVCVCVCVRSAESVHGPGDGVGREV